MKYFTILFFAIILVSATCRNEKDCHNAITIVNNSDKAIYFAISHRYPDTLTLYPNPVPGNNGNKIEKYASGKDMFRDCIEYDFKAAPTLMYFIYDAQTLETVPWDTVVKKYLILKRYDLTLEDLEKQNWTITYP